MGGLTFLNGAFAAGFAALAVPLVIHLMNRRFPRELPFPTVEFLRFSAARKIRIHNLRHLLLLLLRTLLIAALVTAFCLPFLENASVGGVSKDAPAAIILIVDNSASMGYPGKQGKAIDRARQAAVDLLGTLRQMDSANVIFLGADSHEVFPEPASNFRALTKAVEEMEPRPQAALVEPAVGMALEQIRKSAAPRGEIHIISDFQATNWEEADLTSLPANIALSFVDVGEPSRPNIALTSIRTVPAEPVVGSPFELLCEVTSYDEGGADVPVRLLLDGRDAGEVSVQLSPWSTGIASFPLVAEEARLMEFEARLPADDFVTDNQRYAVAQIQPRIRVLVISDQDPGDSDTGLYYLLRALQPGGPDSGRLSVQVIRPGEAANALKSLPDVCILLKNGPGTSDLGNSLVSYVDSGGGLLWFAGVGYDEETEDSIVRASGPKGFIPFIPGTRLRIPESQPPLHLNPVQTDKPPFSVFRSPESGDLSMPEFRACYTTRDVVVRGQVLARFDNGHIALARTAYGKGVLLFANFSLEPDVTDWARRPTFVPFLHECLVSLREGELQRYYHPGLPAEFSLNGRLPVVTVSSPTEERVECTASPSDTETQVLCPNVDEPGIYHVFADGQKAGGFAVNLDPLESDLRTAAVRDVASRTNPGNVPTVVSSSEGSNAIDDMRNGRPVWMAFLIAALALAVLEQAITAIWRVT